MNKFILMFVLLFSLPSIAQTNCDKDLEDLSIAALRLEKTRVATALGASAGYAGFGVGVMAGVAGLIETLPILGGAFSIIEQEDNDPKNVSNYDNMEKVSIFFGGTLLGAAANDIILGPVRVSGDWLINGRKGEFVKDFEYFRAFKNFYFAAKQIAKESVDDLFKKKNSSYQKYLNEYRCIKQEITSRKISLVDQQDVAINSDVELKSISNSTNSKMSVAAETISE